MEKAIGTRNVIRRESGVRVNRWGRVPTEKKM